MIIGITGPTGAGKGIVCNLFEQHGYYHIDTDVYARIVIPEILPELVAEFGEVTDENGELDRKKLADKAFSTRAGTERLNGITHKAIMKRVVEKINELKESEKNDILIDGAALYEAGGDKLCDIIIAVTADMKTRLSRIISRDGISEERALRRMNAQKSDSFYSSKADYSIKNNDLTETTITVEKIINEIKLRKDKMQ